MSYGHECNAGPFDHCCACGPDKCQYCDRCEGCQALKTNCRCAELKAEEARQIQERSALERQRWIDDTEVFLINRAKIHSDSSVKFETRRFREFIGELHDHLKEHDA